MLLEIPSGQVFFVDFQYDPHDVQNRKTRCAIEEKVGDAGNGQVSFGEARTSKKDRFTKAMGRMVAFGRASDKFEANTKVALRAAFRKRFA